MDCKETFHSFSVEPGSDEQQKTHSVREAEFGSAETRCWILPANLLFLSDTVTTVIKDIR